MKSRYLFILLTALLAMNCAHTNWNIDEHTGRPMLSGKQNRAAFKDSSYSWWWNSEYDMYKVDTAALQHSLPELAKAKVKIVMGSWCSDSKREVPRFFKIADAAQLDTSHVEIICVNRKKQSPVKEDIAGLEIEKVPTFIFYRDGKELGRIIESPKESLEKDIAKIIAAK